MSKYKFGIYRKKIKDRLGKYVYLMPSNQKHYTYELLYKKRFANKFFRVLYEAKGETPYLVELFNYSWYEEKFYDKYEFIKEGTLKECDELEEQRLKAKRDEYRRNRDAKTKKI